MKKNVSCEHHRLNGWISKLQCNLQKQTKSLNLVRGVMNGSSYLTLTHHRTVSELWSGILPQEGKKLNRRWYSPSTTPRQTGINPMTLITSRLSYHSVWGNTFFPWSHGTETEYNAKWDTSTGAFSKRIGYKDFIEWEKGKWIFP